MSENHDSGIQNTSLFHLAIEFLSLSASLANTAEEAHSFVLTNHIIDHLHNENRLADTSPSKQSCFPAAFKRREEINGLDTGDKNFRRRGLSIQGHRISVDRAPLPTFDLFLIINRFSENVKDPSQ